MDIVRLTDDEIDAIEASGWVRCSAPCCIFGSTHWHDEDEDTVFLVGFVNEARARALGASAQIR